MSNTILLPALIFMVGGLLVPLFKGKAKSIYMMLIPVAGFINLLMLPHGQSLAMNFGDFKLVLLNLDRLSLLFGYIFHIISL